MLETGYFVSSNYDMTHRLWDLVNIKAFLESLSIEQLKNRLASYTQSQEAQASIRM